MGALAMAGRRVSNRRVVREALRGPFQEAGLGSLRRRWLTFSPVITTYSVRNHPEPDGDGA